MLENSRSNTEISKLHRSRAIRLQTDGAANSGEDSQRNPRFLIFILIGFCLLFIVSYTSRMIEYSRSQVLLGQWEERIDNAGERQSKLVAQREFVYSDDYVDKIAREDLGLAKPGDHVIVIIPDNGADNADNVSNTDASQARTADAAIRQNLTGLPIWQQWLELFKQDSSFTIEGYSR